MKTRKVLIPGLAMVSLLSSAAQAVQYATPGTDTVDATFSTILVSGEYSGTTTITQMTQTGVLQGSDGHYLDFSLMWAEPTAMRVDFASPVSFVSVDFLPNDTDTGVLQVYGSGGVMVGEKVGRDSNPFTLSFSSSSAPFSYILATFADTGKMGLVGYNVATVPEAEVYVLMLIGLGLVGFMARRYQWRR